MPHLLNVWPSVASRLAALPNVLLLLDYDGTLSPIAARPELAVLPGPTRQALAALAGHPRFRVGIVSGRSLSDLRDRVNVPGIIYAGNHGLEIDFADDTFVHPQAAALRPVLEQAAFDLRERLNSYTGVIVEDKGMTLSVHYRQSCAHAFPGIQRVFDQVVSAAGADNIRITRGKMVLEVRPNVDWGKGRAISQILQTTGKGTLPVFFGDDLTDEEGFEVVQDANGIAVFVGPARQPTKAAYRVDSPGEAAESLRLLLAMFPSA